MPTLIPAPDLTALAERILAAAGTPPQPARRVAQGLMVAFYLSVVALVALGWLPWTTLAVFGALPALAKVWKAFDSPRPAQPPPHFPVWPLWFAAIAFLHTRRAGALLVLGLAVAAVFGI